MAQHIADEADRRMGIYRAQPPPEVPEGQPAPPPPPQLPEGTVDAPLVRLYNFLRECVARRLLLPLAHSGCRDDVVVISA